MTYNEVAEVEAKLNIKLPSYYIEFIINLPEDIVNEHGDFEIIADAENLCTQNTTAYDNFWGKPLSKNYFIIGEDGCGDSFLINLIQNEGVILFSHEDQTFYLIAKSLDEYIGNLSRDVPDNGRMLAYHVISDLRKEPTKQSEDKSFFSSILDKIKNKF